MEKLANTPIIEAYCNMIFLPNDGELDVTIPGDFYNAIKEQYTDKKTISGYAKQKLGDSGLILEYAPSYMTKLLRCKHKSLDMFLQLGTNLLTVNHVPPYSEWASFKEQILYASNCYRNVSRTEQIKNIGLSYRNIIDIDSKGFESFNKFFKLGFNIPDELISNIPYSVNFQYECELEELYSLLVVKTMTINKPPETDYNTPVLFEISVNRVNKNLAMDDLGTWLEQAHDSIESVFFGSITEAAKAKYK